MKLFSILLKEGRKEDLQKKYSDKFKEYPDTLDFILGIADLADTNFKYADFVLKNLNPNSSTDEVEDVVELVKDFDRFKQSLEVKDINQYDLNRLQTALEQHKNSSKSYNKNVDTSGTKKIFEDKNILIVRPLTYESSCKYGSGTRWCTTMKGQSSYFQSHTSEDQALYYIILKNFSRDNKFYKIAIHKTPSNETWYDSTDERMSDREKEVFNLGAPKVIETIKADYSKFIEEQGQRFFKKLFDFHNYKFENVSSLFRGTTNYIGIEIQKSEIVPDMPGHATMEMNISVDQENIDQYLVMITYGIQENGLIFNIGYSGDNFEIDPEFDFGIESVSTNFQISPKYITKFDGQTIKSIFNDLCLAIIKQVVYRMKINPEFMASIHGGNAVWTPNRSSYGYTFKRKDSGLIKKLVDYLDSDNKGTKLDFLVDVGSLQKKDINGKPYYSHSNQNNWQIPSAFRGQLSGLFNSARLAGILDYEKEGKTFILKKGPNFEKFKEGQLKSL